MLQVTVAVTPNGRADAVTPLDSAGQLCFALPHESQMPLPALLDRLADKSSDTVIYAQAQNSSLQEFGQLREDIDAELAWAAKIFGQPAEATNLWIGDSRSVTSLHSDPYENMCALAEPSGLTYELQPDRSAARRYAVITGQKRFTLLPPADAHRLCKRRLPVACWEPGEQGLQLRLQEPLSCCSWCPIDRDVMRPQCRADEQQQELYPAMFDPELPEPISVLVGLGDMLYLPAFWHHQVEQLDDDNGRVIACNWWFDTQFTGAVATAQFVERVAQLADESVQS